MGRHRTFDEGQVLERAMHAFRRDGFTPVSVARLELDTGLGVSSLYHAFGDKATLYQRALDHYLDGFVRPRLERYAGPEATLEDLEQLLTTVLDPPLDDGFGCMVTNAVLEQGGSGGIATDAVRRTLDELQSRFADVLRRELPDGAETVAARIVLLYEGLLVLSRAGRASALHRHAIHDEFERLRTQRDAARDTPTQEDL